MTATDWLALFQAAEHRLFPSPDTVPLAPIVPKGQRGDRQDKAIGTNGTIGTGAEKTEKPHASHSEGANDADPIGANGTIGTPSEKMGKPAAALPNGIDHAAASLIEAIRTAVKRRAEFRIVGADIEIDGDLTDELRATLPLDRLYAYLGAAAADREAVAFLETLQVSPVLVTDRDGADAAMAAVADTEIIGFDIETAPPDARPAPIKINGTGKLAVNQPSASKAGLDPHSAIIQTAQLYAGGEHAYVFHSDAVGRLLDSAWFGKQHLAIHNAGFEAKFLRQYGVPLPQFECTMQAAGLLFGVHKRSLAAASMAVLELDPPKLLQTSCWAAPRLSEGQIAYAASDAILALRLWHRLEPMLRETGRYVAYELQRDALAAVADMELRGMAFDLQKHATLIAGWKAEITQLEQQIIDLTGQPAPTGKKAEQAWIASVAVDLLKTWPRTPKSNELSTTAAAYALLENVPAAKPMLALRARKKLLSTYGDSIARQVNVTTHRLHASYAISGAITGRFSCSGPNLQNQPSPYTAADYRKLFIAAPGHVLITSDWKQVELRAMAHVSGDATMTSVFQNGDDLHIETALALSGKRREDLVAEELAILRTHAKAVNFSVIYGSGGKGLAATAREKYGIKLSEAEGTQAIAKFFAKYPGVKRFMDGSSIESTRLGRVQIGCGRAVEMSWLKARQFSPQQCANFPIQGICADAMLRALALTHDRLNAEQIDGGIVGSIHDELILEVAEADAERARRLLQETMTTAFEETFPGAPTTGGVVEVKSGPTWNDTK